MVAAQLNADLPHRTSTTLQLDGLLSHNHTLGLIASRSLRRSFFLSYFSRVEISVFMWRSSSGVISSCSMSVWFWYLYRPWPLPY